MTFAYSLADDPPMGQSSPQLMSDNVRAAPDGKETLRRPLIFQPLPQDMPANVKESYNDYLVARLTHEKWAMRQRQWVYEWQHWSGIGVFLVCTGIVSAGMVMAWMQFKVYIDSMVMYSRKNSEANEGDDSVKISSDTTSPNDQKELFAPNTIQISTTGVNVSSPIVGIIILVLSLAFFYLYLTTVYPITL